MKLSRNILYLFTLLLLLSCNKESDDFYRTDLGKIHGLKNGEDWTASQNYFRFSKEDTVFISFNKYNSYRELREKIGFSNIPFAPGTYLLKNAPEKREKGLSYATYATFAADGDLIVDIYGVYNDDSFENKFTIHEIIEFGDSYIIKGEFQIRLYIDYNETAEGDPDIVTFENMKFKAVKYY